MKNTDIINHFKITIPAKSANEGFSRSLISSFISQLDPTLEELCDVKTAVSEAVTNCIVHAYKDTTPDNDKPIYISAYYTKDNLLVIKIRDKGIGIENVEKAMEPLFTTAASGERAGLGFAVMESFMDKIKVNSRPGKGTTVTLEKRIWGKCI